MMKKIKEFIKYIPEFFKDLYVEDKPWLTVIVILIIAIGAIAYLLFNYIVGF